MKICKICLKEKSFDDFSPRKDGYLKRDARCKKCNAKLAKKRRQENPGYAANIVKKYRERNPEKAKESLRKYREKPDTKEKIKEYTRSRKEENLEAVKRCYENNSNYRKKRNEYAKEWRKKNPTSIKRNRNNDKKKFPEKYRARRKVADAVRRGKIMRPNTCSKCDAEPKIIEGHHEDYSKPLDVIWLCAPCHRNLHKES